MYNLPMLIKANPTYDEAERIFRNGLCSSFTWFRFQVLWGWSAKRYSGYISIRQDVFQESRGIDALYHRFEVVSKLIDKIARHAK